MSPEIDESGGAVLLSAAMTLLSDYEDAIYASCRHSLVAGVPDHLAESRHLVEATKLHADMRRLRLEILDLIEVASQGASSSTA